MSQDSEPRNSRPAPQAIPSADRKEHPAATRSILLATGISAAGGAACLYALTRRNKPSAALAGLGLAAMIHASRHSEPSTYDAQASFVINCTPEKAYRYWRNIENLPRFMRYLESVKVTGENRSEWTAVGSLGEKLQWTAEIVEQRDKERIAWRSVAKSKIRTRGSVEFHALAKGRGTLVSVRVEYVPPGGAMGKAFAAILGKDPKFTVREDLRRFKALLESGETPTTAGQPHGPRGLKGEAQALLLRERDMSAFTAMPERMRPAV